MQEPDTQMIKFMNQFYKGLVTMSFIKSLINITENVITTITVLYGNLCLHDDIGVLYAHSFMLECLKSFYIKKKIPHKIQLNNEQQHVL